MASSRFLKKRGVSKVDKSSFDCETLFTEYFISLFFFFGLSFLGVHLLPPPFFLKYLFAVVVVLLLLWSLTPVVFFFFVHPPVHFIYFLLSLTNSSQHSDGSGGLLLSKSPAFSLCAYLSSILSCHPPYKVRNASSCRTHSGAARAHIYTVSLYTLNKSTGNALYK